MRRLKTSELFPGMVTAEDVYNFNDQLILPKGLVLNDKAITKLASYSVLSVKIEDKTVAAPMATLPSGPSYGQRLRKSPEFLNFQAEFENDVANFKSVISDVVEKGSPLDVDKLMNETLGCVKLCAATPNFFDILHNMREYDDATYIHSINVALICNVFARWLRMDEDEISLATISGLLHDIGKTKIPDAIIKKPSELTGNEFDLVKTHPEEGYRILQGFNLNPAILDAVRMHHERCDGSGYPLSLKGDEIGIFARMVSIADVYEAMTSARIYRGPLCPFKAIELFESEGLQKYDPRLILTFLENVVNTYLLTDVRLSNGDTGKVVFIHKEKLSAPTVQTNYGFLDLTQHPEITIEALI